MPRTPEGNQPGHRTPETCAHRLLRSGTDSSSLRYCNLVLDIVGAGDPKLAEISREQCEFCCQSRPPSKEVPNIMVASILHRAACAIQKAGGVEGCEGGKARALKFFAERFLPLIDLPSEGAAGPPSRGAAPYAGPCRHLGAQSGETRCMTCRGNVRQRIFACHHPRHEKATILQCRKCPDYTPGKGRRTVERWVIGVTTAPREIPVIARTVRSLRSSGWEKEVLWLFAEPGSPVPDDVLRSGLARVIHRQHSALGAWGNFYLALAELCVREPLADAFLMLQDDVVFSPGLREYLEEQLWPGPNPGVVSLHTPAHFAPTWGTGFFKADVGWGAWGAQAFIFSNAAARKFLGDLNVVGHPVLGIMDGRKNVDSVVGDWCRRAGREFWLHSPSLTEHIGVRSTLWKSAALSGKRVSADFSGEQTPVLDAVEHHRRVHGAAPPAPLTLRADGSVFQPGTMEGRDATAATPNNGAQIAVVVTSHLDYLGFLPECLSAWDSQSPSRKVLVLDDCEFASPAGWEVVRGAWRDPNHARNAGIAACSDCHWVIFWDADNVPSPGYFEQARRKCAGASCTTGALYPEVLQQMPDGERRLVSQDVGGDPREGFFVDTASVWRSHAIWQAGGWSAGGAKLDDWSLACRVHAAGWDLAPLGAPVVQRDHPGRRSRTASLADALWQIRPIGIVVLLAGRQALLERLERSLSDLGLPPNCSLTVVDNSGDAEFGARVVVMTSRLSSRMQRVTIIRDDSSASANDFEGIHCHVGGLYSRAVAATPEPLILTWEDDVFPIRADALRQLADQIIPRRHVAGVSGAYRSRQHPDLVVASLDGRAWTRMPTFGWLGARVTPVGMIGGGFTLWSRSALEQCPILGSLSLPGHGRLGWDGFVCRRLNAAGWTLLLHGGVACEHLCA